jgi:hypothetical protein
MELEIWRGELGHTAGSAIITHPQVCAAELLRRVKSAYNRTASNRIFSAPLQAGAV